MSQRAHYTGRRHRSPWRDNSEDMDEPLYRRQKPLQQRAVSPHRDYRRHREPLEQRNVSDLNRDWRPKVWSKNDTDLLLEPSDKVRRHLGRIRDDVLNRDEYHDDTPLRLGIGKPHWEPETQRRIRSPIHGHIHGNEYLTNEELFDFIPRPVETRSSHSTHSTDQRSYRSDMVRSHMLHTRSRERHISQQTGDDIRRRKQRSLSSPGRRENYNQMVDMENFDPFVLQPHGVHYRDNRKRRHSPGLEVRDRSWSPVRKRDTTLREQEDFFSDHGHERGRHHENPVISPNLGRGNKLDLWNSDDRLAVSVGHRSPSPEGDGYSDEAEHWRSGGGTTLTSDFSSEDELIVDDSSSHLIIDTSTDKLSPRPYNDLTPPHRSSHRSPGRDKPRSRNVSPVTYRDFYHDKGPLRDLSHTREISPIRYRNCDRERSPVRDRLHTKEISPIRYKDSGCEKIPLRDIPHSRKSPQITHREGPHSRDVPPIRYRESNHVKNLVKDKTVTREISPIIFRDSNHESKKNMHSLKHVKHQKRASQSIRSDIKKRLGPPVDCHSDEEHGRDNRYKTPCLVATLTDKDLNAEAPVAEDSTDLHAPRSRLPGSDGLRITLKNEYYQDESLNLSPISDSVSLSPVSSGSIDSFLKEMKQKTSDKSRKHIKRMSSMHQYRSGNGKSARNKLTSHEEVENTLRETEQSDKLQNIDGTDHTQKDHDAPKQTCVEHERSKSDKPDIKPSPCAEENHSSEKNPNYHERSSPLDELIEMTVPINFVSGMMCPVRRCKSRDFYIKKDDYDIHWRISHVREKQLYLCKLCRNSRSSPLPSPIRVLRDHFDEIHNINMDCLDSSLIDTILASVYVPNEDYICPGSFSNIDAEISVKSSNKSESCSAEGRPTSSGSSQTISNQPCVLDAKNCTNAVVKPCSVSSGFEFHNIVPRIGRPEPVLETEPHKVSTIHQPVAVINPIAVTPNLHGSDMHTASIMDNNNEASHIRVIQPIESPANYFSNLQDVTNGCALSAFSQFSESTSNVHLNITPESRGSLVNQVSILTGENPMVAPSHHEVYTQLLPFGAQPQILCDTYKKPVLVGIAKAEPRRSESTESVKASGDIVEAVEKQKPTEQENNCPQSKEVGKKVTDEKSTEVGREVNLVEFSPNMKCPVPECACDKSFTILKDFEMHWQSYHVLQKGYSCLLCTGIESNSIYAACMIRGHIRNAHPDQRMLVELGPIPDDFIEEKPMPAYHYIDPYPLNFEPKSKCEEKQVHSSLMEHYRHRESHINTSVFNSIVLLQSKILPKKDPCEKMKFKEYSFSKPSSCPVKNCNLKQFQNKKSFETHWEFCHRPTIRQYTCTECTMKMVGYGSLVSHASKAHKRKKPHEWINFTRWEYLPTRFYVPPENNSVELPQDKFHQTHDMKMADQSTADSETGVLFQSNKKELVFKSGMICPVLNCSSLVKYFEQHSFDEHWITKHFPTWTEYVCALCGERIGIFSSPENHFTQDHPSIEWKASVMRGGLASLVYVVAYPDKMVSLSYSYTLKGGLSLNASYDFILDSDGKAITNGSETTVPRGTVVLTYHDNMHCPVPGCLSTDPYTSREWFDSHWRLVHTPTRRMHACNFCGSSTEGKPKVMYASKVYLKEHFQRIHPGHHVKETVVEVPSLIFVHPLHFYYEASVPMDN